MSDYQIELYLKTFFINLQAWIDNGCPDHESFTKSYGICTNLCGYMSSYPGNILSDEDMVTVDTYLDEVVFEGEPIPFCATSQAYSTESLNKTLYSNKERLAFIKQQATKEIK